MMKKEDSDYCFSMVEESVKTRLVVIGVGGMGNNAMENLAHVAVPGLELYSLNTDVQALRRCRGSKPVQLGAKRTGGKGAGGDSDVGRLSAEDDVEKIRRLVGGAELVFIAAGMGGGTGSGAAPVVARVCREMGVLSVCVVTMPMECEGPRRGEKGRKGLAELRKNVDSLLIIENEKLSTVMEQEDVSIIEVFRKADRVVVDIVAAIARIINSHGYINLDLADLKNVLNRSGMDGCVDAYIGLGEASGPDRGIRASEMALSNPLLRTVSIRGAANLLVNVAGSEQLGHKEAMGVVKNIVDHVGIDGQEIFFGVVTDDGMGDRISVTVIATGLAAVDDAAPKIKAVAGPSSKNRPRQSRDEREITSIRIARDCNEDDASDSCEVAESNFQPDTAGFSPMIRKEEWLVPAYLRTVAKAADLEERVADPRVRKISTGKDCGPAADQCLTHGQFRQPLYHMAG